MAVGERETRAQDDTEVAPSMARSADAPSAKAAATASPSGKNSPTTADDSLADTITTIPPEDLDATETRALDTVRRLGTVGALLLAIGSLGAGAAPVLNPVHNIPVLRLFTRISTVSLAIALAGMGLMLIGWLLLGRFVRPGRSRLATRTQLDRTLIMWLTPLIAIPPLFSRDVYSYLAQSEIVHRGMDPFAVGAATALGIDHPLTSGVSNIWRETPAPYGPLFLKIGSLLSPIVGNSVVTGVLLQRLLALIGVALIVWALPRLARRCGVQPVTALWLGAANPLVIFHLVAGAHNDALAIGLMMAGLEIGIRRLPMRTAGDAPPPLAKGELAFIALGAAIITLAVAVKLNAVIALPFFVVMIARRWHGKISDLFRAGLPLLVLFGLVLTAACLGTGLGFGWIGALGTPGLVHSFLSPTTELGGLGGLLGKVLGLGDHTTMLTSVLGLLGYLVAGLITAKFLWESFRWRYRPMIGLGVSLGAFMILHVALQPWYVLWAVIPLAASAGTSRFRVAATVISVILAVLTPPTGSPFDGRSYVLSQAYLAAAVVVVLALLLVRRNAPMLFQRNDQAQGLFLKAR